MDSMRQMTAQSGPEVLGKQIFLFISGNPLLSQKISFKYILKIPGTKRICHVFALV